MLEDAIYPLRFPRADLGAEVLPGVAEDERLEGNSDVKDQGLGYHRDAVLRADGLEFREITQKHLPQADVNLYMCV